MRDAQVFPRFLPYDNRLDPVRYSYRRICPKALYEYILYKNGAHAARCHVRVHLYLR